VHLKLLKK